jgi:hypothetical protein
MDFEPLLEDLPKCYHVANTRSRTDHKSQAFRWRFVETKTSRGRKIDPRLRLLPEEWKDTSSTSDM